MKDLIAWLLQRRHCPVDRIAQHHLRLVVVVEASRGVCKHV